MVESLLLACNGNSVLSSDTLNFTECWLCYTHCSRPVSQAIFWTSFVIKTVRVDFGSACVSRRIWLLAIYSSSGWLAKFLASSTLNCHSRFMVWMEFCWRTFSFNLPYAGRLLLQALDTVPAEQHKLCAHLGMNHWNKFKWVEWPRLRQQLPHVCGLVFMLCFTSFATAYWHWVEAQKSTTIELAIYQAIKFDFDLPRRVRYSQYGKCYCVVC